MLPPVRRFFHWHSGSNRLHNPEVPALALTANSKMAATTRARVDAREVVRCDACLLVQFHSPTEVCRRCGRPYIEPEHESEPEPLLVPSPMAPTLAATIRSLRLRGGWSQRQLAKRFEPRPVPRTYISKIENGLDTPTLSTLGRLARALEVSVADLLSDQESARSSRIEQLAADPFVAQIAPFVPRLSAMQMSSVLAQMHDMARRQRCSVARGPESAQRTFSATA